MPIGHGCSAREGVIWSAGLVAPCCGSATLVDLRAEGLRRRKRRRVPVNPGRRAGDSARETAAGRAVRAAQPPIARLQNLRGAVSETVGVFSLAKLASIRLKSSISSPAALVSADLLPYAAGGFRGLKSS